MPSRFKSISLFLVKLVGWTLVFAGVYYLTAAVYARMVLTIANLLANLALPLKILPYQQVMVVISPQASGPIGIPYELAKIGLSAIFAPALVLATVGFSISGILRALAALVIMILLGALEISSIVFFYLSHPANTAISLGLSDGITHAIGLLYRFFDRMSYALFPFLAWFLTCSDVIAKLVPGRGRAQSQ